MWYLTRKLWDGSERINSIVSGYGRGSSLIDRRTSLVFREIRILHIGFERIQERDGLVSKFWRRQPACRRQGGSVGVWKLGHSRKLSISSSLVISQAARL